MTVEFLWFSFIIWVLFRLDCLIESCTLCVVGEKIFIFVICKSTWPTIPQLRPLMELLKNVAKNRFKNEIDMKQVLHLALKNGYGKVINWCKLASLSLQQTHWHLLSNQNPLAHTSRTKPLPLSFLVSLISQMKIYILKYRRNIL